MLQILMRNRPNLRHIMTRLLLASMLFAVLAPTALRLGSPTDSEGSLWVQLCTAAGLKWVKAADPLEANASSSPTDDSSHSAKPHCPWCVFQADLGCTLLQASFEAPTPHGSPRDTRALLQPFDVAQRWAATRSRAPPLAAG
jgi:hypothetical protein